MSFVPRLVGLSRPGALALCLSLLAASVGPACASSPDKGDKKEKRVRRYEGPIIDLHVHYDPAQEEAFARNAADPRVFRLAALATANAGRLDETRAQNDRLIALSQTNPKVLPAASVHPADGKAALDEIDRLYQSNVRLIALHTSAQAITLDDARTNDVVAKCGSLGMITLIESGASTETGFVGKVLALAARNPNARIVLLHTGVDDFMQWLAFDAAKRDARTGFSNNVWFDVSAAASTFQSSPYADQLSWVIQRLRDRVVFGSDFPLDTSANVAEAVARLGLSEADAGGVLYTNTARLLGL